MIVDNSDAIAKSTSVASRILLVIESSSLLEWIAAFLFPKSVSSTGVILLFGCIFVCFQKCKSHFPVVATEDNVRPTYISIRKKLVLVVDNCRCLGRLVISSQRGRSEE